MSQASQHTEGRRSVGRAPRRAAGFRSLIEHAQEMISILDAESIILYQSPSVTRLLGYEADELVGRNVFSLLDPVEVPTLHAEFEALLRAPGCTVTREARFRHKDGSWRTLQASGHNLLDDPSVAGIVVNARDVTDHVALWRRSESLLRVAREFAAETDPEQMLRDLVREAVAAVGGESGALSRWDDEVGELLPVRSSIPAGSQADPTLPELDRGVHQQAFQDGQAVVLDGYPPETSGLAPGARSGTPAVVAVPLRHEGRLMGALSVHTTDPRKRFTDQDVETLELLASLGAAALVGLEQARLQGVLLAARTAEHELNNQLARTVGFAELLVNHPRLPDELRSFALEALDGARRAASTVQRFRRIKSITPTIWGNGGDETIDLDRATGQGSFGQGSLTGQEPST